MSVVIRLASLSILNLILSGGAATAAQYRFESWTADDGLPASEVMGFTHDLKGEPLIDMVSGRFGKALQSLSLGGDTEEAS